MHLQALLTVLETPQAAPCMTLLARRAPRILSAVLQAIAITLQTTEVIA